ncbi:MAG: polysulfide reductase NrfD [Euryarchaeota archaeon]|nr:polysulfide reductase NrfD [Euryarchaeota archaeon]
MNGESRTSILFYLWLSLLLVPIALGAYGFYLFLVYKGTLLEATSEIPWGIFIPTYVFFVVLSTGCCIVSTLGNSFRFKGFRLISVRATFVAIITLLCGYIPLMAHLGHLERMGNFVTTPNLVSSMWWMSTFYFMYLLFEITEFWFLTRGEAVKLSKVTKGIKSTFYRLYALGTKSDSKESIDRDIRVAVYLGYIALVFALSAHFTLGSIFSRMESRAIWFGAFLPFNFLISGLRAGIAINIFVVVMTHFLTRRPLSDELKGFITGPLRKLFAFLLAFAILYFDWLVTMSGLHLESYWGWEILLSGPYAAAFWLLNIGCSKLIPFLILILPWTGRSVKWVTLASFIFLVGNYNLRYQWTIVGQLPPVDPLAGGLLHYAPSLYEAFVVFGALSLCMFLYSIGNKLFPLDMEHP